MNWNWISAKRTCTKRGNPALRVHPPRARRVALQNRPMRLVPIDKCSTLLNALQLVPIRGRSVHVQAQLRFTENIDDVDA